MTDVWEVQERADVIKVLTDGNPTSDQIDLFGAGKGLFIDGITKSGSTMNIGMFGHNDFYYFYLRFKPSTDYISTGSKL